MERRKKQRSKRQTDNNLQVLSASGQMLPATVLDWSEDGLCVELSKPLTVGSVVVLNAFSHSKNKEAEVRWCQTASAGLYRVGFSFDHSSQFAFDSEVDYYEVLQIHEKADPDLIHRVYRMLAQRYHPDNPDTGNAELFKLITEAYKVLSDPEKRAGYDIQSRTQRAHRWRIFDQPGAAVGVEAEKRKRQGVLTLLYTKRLTEPASPTLNLRELEDLLGVPKEHLEFTLWYLKERGWIARADNARYQITVSGVEEAESSQVFSPLKNHLLPAASVQ
jgi:hypothetical protein